MEFFPPPLQSSSHIFFDLIGSFILCLASEGTCSRHILLSAHLCSEHQQTTTKKQPQPREAAFTLKRLLESSLPIEYDSSSICYTIQALQDKSTYPEITPPAQVSHPPTPHRQPVTGHLVQDGTTTATNGPGRRVRQRLGEFSSIFLCSHPFPAAHRILLQLWSPVPKSSPLP